MTALEVLTTLEAAGARLSLNEGRIRLENGVPARLSRLVDELRRLRDDAVAVLASRIAALDSWLRNSCVALPNVCINARALYRNYRSALRETGVDYSQFTEQLERHGYACQDEMVTGLMLASDFRGIVLEQQADVPAIKEPASGCNRKPRLCLGACHRLMMHRWVDGQWFCMECGTPGLSRTYARQKPAGGEYLQ